MQIDHLSPSVTRIGVVADTHIPDRLKRLPASVFEKLRGVDAILHAGDLSAAHVVKSLETIAPVFAVQGNRDMITRYGRTLPTDRLIEIGKVRIGLTHGHGGWRGYLKEKLHYHLFGYGITRTIRRAQQRFEFEQMNAIIFGHTHRPYNAVCDQVLVFNPGSVGPDYYTHYGAAVGIITIADSAVRGEIIPLSSERV
jgi:putative phosphoesterase